MGIHGRVGHKSAQRTAAVMALATFRRVKEAFAPAPIEWHDEREHRRKLAEKINDMMQGDLNATGDVTLTASQATTTVTDRRVSASSYIGFMPVTANAGGEVGMYVSSRGEKTFTITHAVDSRSDRTFKYVVIG
jgi:hypothetical protein